MADANKMITRAECNSIAPGAFTGELNRCPTKAEIVATGRFTVSGSYADNQLVKYADVKAMSPSLSISPTTQSIGISGSSFTLNITCNTTWKITYPSWCSGTASGRGNSSVRVTVASNSGKPSRSGSITVTTTAPSNNITKTCSVSQSGLPTIQFGVWGLTSSSACKVTAQGAVRDAIMVHIEVNTTDGVSSGMASFAVGNTEASVSIWPPIFDENTVRGYRVVSINYNGKMYANPPITTGNAVYQW